MQVQQINLLTAMTRESAAGEGLPVWVPWLLMVLILLSGVGVYQKNVEMTALKGQITGLKEKKDFLIKEMGAAEAAMKDVVQILAAKLSKRIRWSPFMREVSMIIPEGVWITRWENIEPPVSLDKTAQNETDTIPKAVQVKMAGEALSQEQLALFLSTLDRSPLLTESRLAHARKMNKEMQFEVIVTLKMEHPK